MFTYNCRAFSRKPGREEEGKTFSNDGYARSKFASIIETGRHRRGEKTSSNSGSEEFEQESRDILCRLEKQSHLARKEDTRTIQKPCKIILRER